MNQKEKELETQRLQHPYELFGIECGDGWEKLYQPIIDEIVEYNNNHSEEDKITISQIKEKFGGLRFYADNTPTSISEKIDQAESKSYHVCERCGSEHEVGFLSMNGWIYTRCRKCAENLISKSNCKSHIRFMCEGKKYITDENGVLNEIVKKEEEHE